MTCGLVKSVCEPEPPGRIKWIEKKDKKKKKLSSELCKGQKQQEESPNHSLSERLPAMAIQTSPFRFFSPFLWISQPAFCCSTFLQFWYHHHKKYTELWHFFKGWFRGRNPRWMKIKQEVRNTFFFFSERRHVALLPCCARCSSPRCRCLDPDGLPSGLLLSPLLFPPFIPSFACCFSLSLFSAGGRLAQVLHNNLP